MEVSYSEIRDTFEKLQRMIDDSLLKLFKENETYKVNDKELNCIVSLGIGDGDCEYEVSYVGLNDNGIITLYDSDFKEYMTIRNMNLLEKKYLLKLLVNRFTKCTYKIVSVKYNGETDYDASFFCNRKEALAEVVYRVTNQFINDKPTLESTKIKIDGYKVDVENEISFRIVTIKQ